MEPISHQEGEILLGARGNLSLLSAEQVCASVREALSGGDIERAASLIASCSAEVGDALLTSLTGPLRVSLAEAFFVARDFDRAARAAEGVDPERAAHLLERGGQLSKAAVIRERLGQVDAAAELFQRGGDHARAASLFLGQKRLDLAAEAFERAGKLFDAGRLWSQQRRLDRAVEALQRVDAADPTFTQATMLLGRILEFSGHPEAAAARYQELARQRPIDASTVEMHERLLAMYVQAGNVSEARRLINKILKFDSSRPYAARAIGLLLGKGDTEATMRSEPPSFPSPSIPASMADRAPLTLTAVNPRIDQLRQLPLFSELSLAELRSLAAAGDLASFAPGEVLIEQDQEGAFFFVLLSGAVRVLRVDGGRETELAELRYGSCLGEMALLDEGPASARVRAVAPTEAFRWPLASFRRLLASDERVGLRVLRVASRALSGRLREASRRVR